MESLTLSHSLQELVSRFFKEDKQKRPRAFELGSSEFLATDAPILFEPSSALLSSSPSVGSLQAFPTRRRDSTTARAAVSSRYAEDFVEEGRLGKGGFGEVVKARKKLDGQIYAIKKITQRSQTSLTEILKEVRLLSQLSHPAVVRYYNTWVEEVAELTDTEGETSTDDYTDQTGETKETGSDGIDIQFATSTGGLDFMSSNAAVEFDYDDESEETESDEGSEDDDDDVSADEDAGGNQVPSPHKERHPFAQRRPSRFQRPYRTILYISMEYCEKRVSTRLCRNAANKFTDG
jgi:translation initiation factor 2-alpha kinase 4